MAKIRKNSTWQSSLLATSGLAAALFAASLLWQNGLAEWAFLLGFGAVWVVLAVTWANIDYSERSGVLLAHVMDRNFEQMHERLVELEREVEALQDGPTEPWRKAS